MRKIFAFGYAVVLLICIYSCSDIPIRIACVGDSITEGYGLTWQSRKSYPVMLDSMLGADYTVLNFGRSATTLRKGGNYPYWTCKEFSNVFASQPDIIIIKLGTNDTKPENWQPEQYKLDYQALIDTFNTLKPKPRIYLCMPVPVFETRWGINDSTVINGILPLLGELAQENSLPVIDLYDGMKNYGEHFYDGIHPDEIAIKKMAELIAVQVTNKE